MSPETLPIQCALDQKMLADIASKVDKISGQMDGLESRTGPIAAHDLRLQAVEALTVTAQERLDAHHQDIEALKKANTALQVRLGVVLVPLASAIGAVVAKLL